MLSKWVSEWVNIYELNSKVNKERAPYFYLSEILSKQEKDTI